ncbi:MAG: hypothetical protein P1V20_00620 [Verrucomicrobiales bacterium]|nr:hypothetical protein [Verrucomicrobiales bacterium]
MKIFSETYLYFLGSSTEKISQVFETLPFFPGQIVIFLLIGLSAASWSVIVSKYLLIRQIRSADQKFIQRLKRSRTCLEVFESCENFEPSILFDIYDEGARATARETVGSDSPKFLTEHNLVTHHSLSRTRFDQIGKAFSFGEKYATFRLRKGFRLLRGITIAAPLLGLAGSLLFILDPGNGHTGYHDLLSYCSVLLVSSFFVAAPAGIARTHLLNRCRKLARKSNRFRNWIFEVFRSSFEENEQIVPNVNPVRLKDEMEVFDLPTHFFPESGCPVSDPPKERARPNNPDSPYVNANY